MNKIRFTLFTALVLLINCNSIHAQEGANEQAGSLAVIVHPDIKQESVSMDDLKKMLVGDIRFWKGGELVTLLVQAPVSWERDTLLSKVMGMSEPQYRQYWISKVFRTEVASGPKVVLSNEMAGTLVSKIPGAMAFVINEGIPIGAKILKVDNLLPGDENYPLNF